MKKIVFIFGLILSLSIQAQDSKDINYIRKHALLAVEEMYLYKIPASITLSQGLLETGGGQSRLAEQAFNHFGIKCKTEWTGGKIYHDDDARGECFRVYNDVQESYRDHSKFLAERPYYKSLFTLKTTDYKAWAKGLKTCGYATNPKYADILISRIEKYNLNQFDHLKPEDVYAKLTELYGEDQEIVPLVHHDSKFYINQVETQTKQEIRSNDIITTTVTTTETIAFNDTDDQNKEGKKITVENRNELPSARIKNHGNKIKYIVAKEGETLSSIAKLYNTDANTLAKYNELTRDAKLTPGQYVFFSKKKKKGPQKFYRVAEGDNMYLIAQRMGIRVSDLYSLNKMAVGSQPKVGEVLYLTNKKS